MYVWTQDIDDDEKVGVKSTARLFGHERAKMWLTGFAACMVSGLTLVGHNAGHSWPYFATVAACAAHLAWQVRRMRCWRYNITFLWMLYSVYIAAVYKVISCVWKTCMYHLPSCMCMQIAPSNLLDIQYV